MSKTGGCVQYCMATPTDERDNWYTDGWMEVYVCIYIYIYIYEREKGEVDSKRDGWIVDWGRERDGYIQREREMAEYIYIYIYIYI